MSVIKRKALSLASESLLSPVSWGQLGLRWPWSRGVGNRETQGSSPGFDSSCWEAWKVSSSPRDPASFLVGTQDSGEERE